MTSVTEGRMRAQENRMYDIQQQARSVESAKKGMAANPFEADYDEAKNPFSETDLNELNPFKDDYDKNLNPFE